VAPSWGDSDSTCGSLGHSRHRTAVGPTKTQRHVESTDEAGREHQTREEVRTLCSRWKLSLMVTVLATINLFSRSIPADIGRRQVHPGQVATLMISGSIEADNHSHSHSHQLRASYEHAMHVFSM